MVLKHDLLSKRTIQNHIQKQIILSSFSLKIYISSLITNILFILYIDLEKVTKYIVVYFSYNPNSLFHIRSYYLQSNVLSYYFIILLSIFKLIQIKSQIIIKRRRNFSFISKVPSQVSSDAIIYLLL